MDATSSREHSIWNGSEMASVSLKLDPFNRNREEAKMAFVVGTNRKDDLEGTRRDDFIFGKGGDDKIDARAGDDYVEGGKGDDKIFGGKGDDKLYGDNGPDRGKYYDKGDRHDDHHKDKDDMEDDKEADRDYAKDKNDWYHGHGNGKYKDDGDDVIYGGKGDDKIYGEGGDDYLHGGKGHDHMYGGRGHDGLNGDKGDDRLYGEEGRDWLKGGDGKDKLYGGKGDDVLVADKHDKVLDGGDGKDVVKLDGDGTFDYRGVISNVENVVSGDKGNQTLILDEEFFLTLDSNAVIDLGRGHYDTVKVYYDGSKVDIDTTGSNPELIVQENRYTVDLVGVEKLYFDNTYDSAPGAYYNHILIG
ncbi:calcium-binding protein [Pseudoroseomonas oryzae]|uniref:Calcium-binding protein n=2 Tax=Teichococcus oryzae TaxID=1608942 RepID=A0A5B2TDW8_9PROT|nr:calcium-binding protein [Pseudoroseomonas oryzae]